MLPHNAHMAKRARGTLAAGTSCGIYLGLSWVTELVWQGALLLGCQKRPKNDVWDGYFVYIYTARGDSGEATGLAPPRPLLGKFGRLAQDAF